MALTRTIKFPNTLTELEPLLVKLQRALSAVCLSTAGLVIKAGSSALVKAATAHRVYVEGTLVVVAANTDMAALAGTVTNAKFNVFVFTVNAAGTQRSYMGTEASTIGGV